jgi:Bacterial RNA polymerase, alpha chain C terminal domain
VAGLCARTEADLLAIANLGPASVKEIKQKLAERGLALAPAGTATGPAGTATSPAGTATSPAGTATSPAGSATAGAGTAPAAADTARDADGLDAPPLTARPPDEDAIDLLSVAGFPVLRRALPIAGAVAVLLLVLLGARRRHHHRANASSS